MCTNRRIKYVGFRSNPVSAVYEIPAITDDDELLLVELASAKEPEPVDADDQLRVLTVMAIKDQPPSSPSSTGTETVPAALEQEEGDQKRHYTGNNADDSSSIVGADDHHQQDNNKKRAVSTIGTITTTTCKNEKKPRLPLHTVHKMTAAAEQGLETPLVPNMWDVLGVVNPRLV
jgi:hypothetical protein